MKTVIENGTKSAEKNPVEKTKYSGPIFRTTLSDGREIAVREMKGADLIYLEENLSKYGETAKSFHLIERLNVGSVQITFEDISELGIRDIKKISELVAKANGDDFDEEGDDSPK